VETATESPPAPSPEELRVEDRALRREISRRTAEATASHERGDYAEADLIRKEIHTLNARRKEIRRLCQEHHGLADPMSVTPDERRRGIGMPRSDSMKATINRFARTAPSRAGAGQIRATRTGRSRTASRTASGGQRRTTSTTRDDGSGSGDDPPPPAQPQRWGDEQDRGNYTSRPRRTGGELIPVWRLLLPLLDRLEAGAR